MDDQQSDQRWQTYSSILRRLLQRPQLRDKFRQDVDGSATADLNIPADMRTDLKNLLMLLESQTTASRVDGVAERQEDSFQKSTISAQEFFDRTYAHLRRGAIATMVMSSLIFLMGLLLLAVAATQSLRREEPGIAVVLAASGIVAIAAASLLMLLESQTKASRLDGVAERQEDSFQKSALSAEKFFTRTYAHLRRGAIATMVMSILIFLMGLLLLAVAATQSLRGDEPGTAVALAASGIVAIAAAFYRSPVSQMRESAAEMQRASMVLMSYMLGLSLLSRRLSGQETADANEMLTALTRDLAGLLSDPQPPDTVKDS